MKRLGYLEEILLLVPQSERWTMDKITDDLRFITSHINYGSDKDHIDLILSILMDRR